MEYVFLYFVLTVQERVTGHWHVHLDASDENFFFLGSTHDPQHVAHQSFLKPNTATYLLRLRNI